MKALIKKKLSGKKVLLLFILTNIVYAMMMIFTIPLVMSFSDGMKLLDMMPLGYNVEYVDTLLSVMGESGREAYLLMQIPLDMIYPFLFGISYCLILAYFLNKLGKFETWLYLLCFTPLFAGIFDYFENIGIITLLTTYPNHSIVVVQATNVFSVLKSSFTTIYFMSLIITVVIFGFIKLFRKK